MFFKRRVFISFQNADLLDDRGRTVQDQIVFAQWGQVVRNFEARTPPFTFDPEVERQISLINAESGPSNPEISVGQGPKNAKKHFRLHAELLNLSNGAN